VGQRRDRVFPAPDKKNRFQTKAEISAPVLHFCAAFLERNGKNACVAADTIRNAANVLISAEAPNELPA
jgi:hypothetical protein